MPTILERLRAGECLICDGAMGTFLQERGLQPGECPERWCLDRPDDVRAIHQAYREAGSDIVECNSFGGTRYKLAHFGLADQVAEINRAAASLAREVAGSDQYVLGAAGPTGTMLEPYGTESPEAVYDAFREQIVALEEGGADAVIIETMLAVEEAELAVRAAREHTDLTILVSFTFEPAKRGGYRTMMGIKPDQIAEPMLAAGADILGANCGTGIDDMVAIIRDLRASAGDAPLIAMANAGRPVVENGCTVFKETPEAMAGHVADLRAAGAAIIGGCCGTGPAHIAAIRRVLREMA